MATPGRGAPRDHLHGLRVYSTARTCIREVDDGEAPHPARVLDVADECLQIHGGYGYMREYGIERAVRDARLGPIGGGTDEIMKEILGKQLGL